MFPCKPQTPPSVYISPCELPKANQQQTISARLQAARIMVDADKADGIIEMGIPEEEILEMVLDYLDDCDETYPGGIEPELHAIIESANRRAA